MFGKKDACAAAGLRWAVAGAGPALAFSALAIAGGSSANDFGALGVKEHCLTIDSPVQADAFNREVRIRMLQCMTQDTELLIAIGGGGTTGAELVQLTEDAVAYGAKGWAARVRITLS